MKKILIVDDEEDILFLLKIFLSRKGYEVITTLSCGEGLETFYSFKPDLLLLDVNVGDSDGRVMCKTIKAQQLYESIPIILISANSHALLSYADYASTSFMEKPINLPDLLSIVQCHLKHKLNA